MHRVAEMALPPMLRILDSITAFLLFAMIVVTFVDVSGRYLLAKPVFGATEMIEFLLATTIFAGLSRVDAENGHISVDLFEHAIHKRIPRIHDFVVKGVSVAAMAVIAWQIGDLALEIYAQDGRTVVLEWPLFWVIGAVSVLSAVSAIVQILGWFVEPQRSRAVQPGGFE